MDEPTQPDHLSGVFDDVHLRVPSHSAFLRSVRLVAADVAARSDLDCEEIDDFRIAVDELVHAAMTATDHDVELAFRCGQRRAEVVGAATSRGGGGVPAVLPEISVAILSGVCDAFEFGTSGSEIMFSVVKHAEAPGEAAVSEMTEVAPATSAGGPAGESAVPRSVDPRFAEYRRTHDRELRNELVEAHMRLAEFLARRFAHRSEPLDDLRQVALVGLLKAVERFEPDRGVQFSSFATPTIVGELKRHFRDRGWAVRVPRRIQELHLELERSVVSLSQELGRPPTIAEIAQRAGASEEDVLESLEASALYQLASLDSDRNPGSVAIEDRIGTEDHELEAVDDRLAVGELLATLPARERRIVYLRFFEGLSQSEIATEIGISQMHVSRLLSRSLEALARQRADATPV